MAGINKVIIIGNLGKDPETKFMPNGNAVTNFSIATSETWKDKNTGQKQEQTEWHNMTAFGRIAEVINQYVKKGSKLYCEGKLKTDSWNDEAGTKKYKTSIIVNKVEFLDSKQQQGFAPQQQQQGFAPQQQQQGFAPQQQQGQYQGQQQQQGWGNQQAQQTQPHRPQQEPQTFDDDIPFN